MNARNFRKSFAEPERKKACPPPITRATTSAFFISCWKCVRDCPFLICLERERGRGKDDATQDFPSVTPQWELERERERVGPNNRVFARLPPPARTSTPQVFCPGRGIMILPPLPFTLPSSLTVQQIFCSSFPLTRESSLSLKHQLSSALFCYTLVSCKFLRLLRIRPLRASCSATRSARSPAPWSSSPAASSSSSSPGGLTSSSTVSTRGSN